VKVKLLYIEPKISRFGELTPELEEAVKIISVSIINSLKERTTATK
jgi:Ni,Fe-hydrogenase maturation factor